MSNEQHLPGYSLEDEPHPHPPPPIQSPTVEPDGAQEPVPNASDDVAATTPPEIAQPQPLTPWRSQQPSSATPSPPAEQPAVDEFADPKIASLHAIFPDFDAAILYSVVDSVDGDQDRAVDALLSMSDPDHVATSAAAPAQPPVTTQTQLDEEFARQLLLEDEQRYARDQIARQQQQQLRQFPYAQRTTAGNPQQQQDRSASPQSIPSQREGNTMADVQDQFSKIAESGKRTFSTLVSKVKAKVQEFDQSRNTQNPSNPSTSGASTAPQQPYASSGLDRHAQQAYYAPRLDPSPRADADPPPSVLSNLGPGAPAPYSATDDLPAAPPTTHAGRPLSSTIDPGKIGLLPKRPVSLVDSQSQSQQQSQQYRSPSHPPDDSDEEDLEYVENPFEEGRHS